MYNRKRSERTQTMLDAFQAQAYEMYSEITELKIRFIRHLLSFYQDETCIITKEYGKVQLQSDYDGRLFYSYYDEEYEIFTDDLDPIIEALASGEVYSKRCSKDGYFNYAPLKNKAIKPLQFTVDITAPK